MNPSFLLTEGQPTLFQFFHHLQKNAPISLQTFLILGQKGKEFYIIKIMQMLNCPHFFDSDHRILNCKTCYHINALQSSFGVYSIFSTFDFDAFTKLLNAYTPSCCDLLKESLLHQLYKMIDILEIYLYKDTQANKNLTDKKIKDLTEMIFNAIYGIKDGASTLFKEKDTPHLQAIFENAQHHVSIAYLEKIHQSLYTKSQQYPFQFLIIKDCNHLSPLLQNHLLKLAEEPPKNTIIFFVASHFKNVLPTILSRCIKMHLKPYPSSYKDKIKSLYPDYPLESLISLKKQSIRLTDTLPPYQEDLPLETILIYYEKLKSSFGDLSPMSEQKRILLDQILDGGKNYSLNKKHLYDTLAILWNRLKK